MKKRFITIIMFVVIIPSFLVNIIASMLYAHYMTKRIENNYEYAYEINNENAKETFRRFENILNRLASDGKIKEKVMQLGTAENLNKSLIYSKEIDAEINGIIASDDNYNENTYTITVYPLNENVACIGEHVDSVGNISHKAWFKDIKSGEKLIYVDKTFGRNALCVATQIYDGNDFLEYDNKIAVIVMEIEASKFLKNMIQRNSRLLSIELYNDEHGERIRYGDGSNDKDLKTKYIVENDFTEDGWKIKCVFDMQEEYNAIRISVLFWLLIVVLLVIIDLIIVIKSSNEVVFKLDHILEKMQHIQKGEWGYTDTLGGTDEFSKIDGGLNEMSLEIERIIGERYVADIAKRMAEMNALKLQLNPHFIYNTLENVSSIARQKECNEITLICSKMADILRYNLNSDNEDDVVLADEIDLVKNYYEILKIRFSDRINIYYDIPKELESVKVIKFLLQPLVENVVKHVISKDMENHMVVIAARETGDLLEIEVMDDGEGLEKEQVQHIIETIETGNLSDDRNIGLKNINLRLKLAYGDKAELAIESVKGAGTKIIVRLPVEKEDANV